MQAPRDKNRSPQIPRPIVRLTDEVDATWQRVLTDPGPGLRHCWSGPGGDGTEGCARHGRDRGGLRSSVRQSGDRRWRLRSRFAIACNGLQGSPITPRLAGDPGTPIAAGGAARRARAGSQTRCQVTRQSRGPREPLCVCGDCWALRSRSVAMLSGFGLFVPSAAIPGVNILSASERCSPEAGTF